MKRTHHRMQWPLLVIILLAFWLGARSLIADILFVDEYWSIRNSGGDPFGPLNWSGVWQRTAILDPGGMGVLYHWLLNSWQQFIGSSVFSVRAYSLFTGILAVASLYRLGSVLFSHRIGLYAAAIMATSAFYVDYLHEARAYTQMVLFANWAVYAYHHIMNRRKAPARWWYIALALSLAALAYTHYVALAMGAVLGLYHLLHFRKQSRWWLALAAMAAGGLLFVPWLGITIEVIRRGTEDVSRQGDSMGAVQIIQHLFSTFSNANLALLALLSIYALRQITRWALLIWLWLIAALVLVIIVNTVIPFVVSLRYLLLVWPALALIAALGIQALAKGRVPATLVLTIWMAAGVYQSLHPAFIESQFGQIYRAPADGFQLARAILNQRGQAGDLALFHIMPPQFESFALFPLGYYMDETPFNYDQFERMNNSFATGDNDYLRDVETAMDSTPAIWTLVVPALERTQRSGVVNYVLATTYSQCESILERDDMVMRLYARRPEYEAQGSFQQKNAANVALYDLQRGYQTRDALHLTLGYWSENLPPGTYSVALHLMNLQGELVAQSDFALPDKRPFSCSGATIPLAGLPAGEYQLQAVIYEWQSGERLLTASGDAILFDTITIDA